jgi:uncharacterized membrane protein
MSLKNWFKKRYREIVNSIAFYPALIALFFLIVAIIMFRFDFSELGKSIKTDTKWLNINDSNTARSIISAIASGTISLAVFSFSMVMIVLNQAAAQMSNRVLNKLIGNMFQQVVLGIYIGTIVYAFFLLSTIRDTSSLLYIPSLSIYLLIIITITDIFLFIYFLHYITQSVKYDVIIRRIHKNTFEILKINCVLDQHPNVEISLTENATVIYAHKTGIYENVDKKELLKICKDQDCFIKIVKTPGSTILKNSPIAYIDQALPKEVLDNIESNIFINDTESIDANFVYGFKQLTEVAIKALSPGINDPGTAVISLRSLFDLYCFRINHHPNPILTDNNGKACVYLNQLEFEKIFLDTMLPIWDYGKKDFIILQQLLILLTELKNLQENTEVTKLLNKVKKQCAGNSDFD